MGVRGIAPVAAVLVLVLITVVASIVTYVWVSSYIKASHRVKEPVQLSEALFVEEASFVGGTLRVVVRNVGSRKATIAALYVLNRDRTAALARTGLAVDLEPGSAAKIEIEAELAPSSYIVKLVTKTGVEAATTLARTAFLQRPEEGPPPEAPSEEPRVVVFRIRVDPPGGGTTYPEPGDHRVLAGSGLTVTATPKPGYLFLRWLLNGEHFSSERSITLTVNGDAELTAVFIERQHGTPAFRITSWSERISGPVGSMQTFNASVENVGDAPGNAWVKILDDGWTLASQLVELEPGEERSISLSVQLPGTRGVFTWRLVVENAETGVEEDGKIFTVEAKDLHLARRSALHYTAFEGLPEGWVAWGGDWSLAPRVGLLSTNALQGADNNGGPGGASLYHVRVAVEPSVYIAVQLYVRVGTPAQRRPDMMGVALVGAAAVHAVIIDFRATGGDRGFEVHRLTESGWSRVASVRYTPSLGAWHTLIVELSGDSLTARLYTGGTVHTLQAQVEGLSLENAGLIIDDGVGLFDNFVISSSSPEYIAILGLQQGWVAELYAASALIDRGTADAGGVARLRMVPSLVALDAKIVVKDADKRTIIEKSFTEIVGGDVFAYG